MHGSSILAIKSEVSKMNNPYQEMIEDEDGLAYYFDVYANEWLPVIAEVN